MYIYIVTRTKKENNKETVTLEKAFYSRSSAETYAFSIFNDGQDGKIDVEEVPLEEESFI